MPVYENMTGSHLSWRENHYWWFRLELGWENNIGVCKVLSVFTLRCVHTWECVCVCVCVCVYAWAHTVLPWWLKERWRETPCGSLCILRRPPASAPLLWLISANSDLILLGCMLHHPFLPRHHSPPGTPGTIITRSWPCLQSLGGGAEEQIPLEPQL